MHADARGEAGHRRWGHRQCADPKYQRSIRSQGHNIVRRAWGHPMQPEEAGGTGVDAVRRYSTRDWEGGCV